jgi:hypothetical protein
MNRLIVIIYRPIENINVTRYQILRKAQDFYSKYRIRQIFPELEAEKILAADQ